MFIIDTRHAGLVHGKGNDYNIRIEIEHCCL
jgi:hypothetical protein